MSRKKTSRARPRSLGKKLTPKQAAFLRNYTDPKSDAYGNGTRACKRAGYKGDPGTLAVQGSRNLRHPQIREEMRTALYEQGFTPEFAAKTLMGAMRATVVRPLPNGKGKLVPHRFPDHRTRLQGYDRACRLVGAIEDKQGYEADAEFEPDRGTFGGVEYRASGREYWSESEGWVANPYAEMSPTDRMFVRSCAEKTIALARLKESSGIGSTHDPSQAGSGQRDRPPSAPSERDHKQ